MRDSAIITDAELEAIDTAAHQGVIDVREYCRRVMEHRHYHPDEAQQRAILHLQGMYEQWQDYKNRRSTTLRRLLIKPPLPRGVYLWGGVGRGKSFLMDSFYLCVPLLKKRRVHFHHFMRDVHRALEKIKGTPAPLSVVAERISSQYRLICFDEFHVNDIADAMILGRLLQALLDNRVMLCMTSNYHPDQLWADGLQRERFLPTIGLIKEHLDIVQVDGGTDYRQQALSGTRTYHYPLNDETVSALKETFERVAEIGDEYQPLDVEGRKLAYRRRAGGVVWFDFATLCGTARSYADYVDLARRFHTIVLDQVPCLGARQASAARRFVWLIDVMYDTKVKMIIAAAVPPEGLYVEGPMQYEFGRTVSRIREMQSVGYLNEPRLSPEGFGAVIESLAQEGKMNDSL